MCLCGGVGGWGVGGGGFLCQAEDGIRDLVRSRGLGDVYKRQGSGATEDGWNLVSNPLPSAIDFTEVTLGANTFNGCLLYTSDAADERSSVDLGGRRII